MKPRIRKKDKTAKGNSRYVLEWEEDGKIQTFALNPSKILDYVKLLKNSKEKD